VKSFVATSPLSKPRLWAVNGNGDISREYLDENDDNFEFQDMVINNVPTDINSEATTTRSPVHSYFNGYSMTSGYSAFLDKNDKTRDDLNEDGYADLMKRGKHRSFWKKVIKFPINAAKSILSRGGATKEPGTLILVRHGESTWNRNKTFTGWSDDADLTDQGTREMEHAARLLMEQGYEIDIVFTSRLKRAIRSTWILLQELNEIHLPVLKSWRINERHYGSLTGLSKTQTAERLGADLVQEWRGSLRSRPPPMTEDHPYYPGRERKYADLTKDQIPLTESLLDCMERTIPLWETKLRTSSEKVAMSLSLHMPTVSTPGLCKSATTPCF
jgi:2,3-bisphosphoglycerate-dependent phosphoglycerate mutase